MVREEKGSKVLVIIATKGEREEIKERNQQNFREVGWRTRVATRGAFLRKRECEVGGNSFATDLTLRIRSDISATPFLPLTTLLILATNHWLMPTTESSSSDFILQIEVQ